MAWTRNLILAGLAAFALSGAASAECRGGAVSGIPACTSGSSGGGGGYTGGGEGSGWYQRNIDEREARRVRFNELIAQAGAAASAGNIEEFNRLAALADGRTGKIRDEVEDWVQLTNGRHYAERGNAAVRANQIPNATAYYTRSLAFLRDDNRRNVRIARDQTIARQRAEVALSGVDSCSVWMTGWRVCVDRGGRAYCQDTRNGQVSRVGCHD